MNRRKRLTIEVDALFSAEAVRRADGLPRNERSATKDLAAETGFAYGYVANIIARKRRELEKKVHISSTCN